MFNKNVISIKKLVEKIGDLSEITLQQKNFFLYDESNYINHTFYNELNKKVQMYSVISTPAIGIKTTHLITTATSPKFGVTEDKHKEQIVLQLEDIRKPGKIATKGNKITNFSILRTEQKKTVGTKKNISLILIDEVKIGGLKNYNVYNELNHVDISIRGSELNSFLSRYNRRYKYWVVRNNLLFSSSVTQDTNVIFVSCNGLNDAKDVLINGKLYKTPGVVNINQIEEWQKLKGKSKWVNAVFNDSEDLTVAKHFAFAFTTNSLQDILNFELNFLDDKANLITFILSEKKVPVLNFSIQIEK